MNYVELEFEETDSEKREILIAFLGEAGFEMFEELDDSFKAFVKENEFDEEALEESVLAKFQQLTYSRRIIGQQNWNALWEKNFEPIEIGGVHIRAPFHEAKPGVKHELIIEPKMSFGTGHHATTSLMISEMLKTDFKNKTVLDMGCGTSLLAILASKLGAANILAVDIDEWAAENSKENCERNAISNVTVVQGNAADISGKYFDIILANINRNVLIADMQAYASALNSGGEIIFSGFYESDVQAIKESSAESGFVFMLQDILNQWAVMKCRKA